MPLPWIISVDDHVIEPPDLWLSRMPARFRARGPRVVRMPWERGPNKVRGVSVRPSSSGPEVDFWAFGDIRVAVLTVEVAAGLPPEKVTVEPTNYDGHAARAAIRPRTAWPTWTRPVSSARCAFPTCCASPARSSLDVGPGSRTGLRQGLQRLDGGGVGGRQRRAVAPVVRCPAVGPGPGCRGGPAQRGTRVSGPSPSPSCPANARASEHPRRRRPLAAVHRGVRRDRHGDLHAHRLVVDDCAQLSRRPAVQLACRR